MMYRYLGKTGMKVSVIGVGNMNFNKDTTEFVEDCFKCVSKALEKGINFFDTAEWYGTGGAETVLGKALTRTKCPRKDFVLSTKVFSCGSGVNDLLLSRKHIIEGVTASLARLQVDYADILFAHRYDAYTPMEETCRAFNWLIDQGKAYYWGTSEWTSEQIMEAFECCDRLGLCRPVADQVEYNMIIRRKFEGELAPLFERHGYGTTTWSPLAGGYLTGKYNNGNVPGDTRYTAGKWDQGIINEKNEAYIGKDPDKFYKRLNGLGEIAKEMKCTQAQLALAWTIVNKDVSTAVMGSTKPHQIEDCVGAIEVVKRWTPEVEKKIEAVLDNTPPTPLNPRTFQNFPGQRSTAIEFPKA